MGNRSKINYSEGTCFLVPLRTGGYARGVVAKLDGKGLVFGYFFGPKLLSPEEGSTGELNPERAVLLGKFGDLSLQNGEWLRLGQVDNWIANEWVMPPLIRVDQIEGKAILSHYNDQTFECTREEEVSPTLADQYPYDRTMGAGAVEIRLSKLVPM